ncbi:MAG: hypothetical protein ACE5GQ_11425 [Nitrospinales bacterium]
MITRFLIAVAFVASLALSAGSVFAVTNASSVISPYWQSDGNIYTFLAVSHSSLDGMSSQVGVVLKAKQDNGTTDFGTATFTIEENKTTRIFIVATNHTTINPTKVSGAVFITGTTNAAQGSLVATSKASNPTTTSASKDTGPGSGFRDVTMLSFWGAVVIPGGNTGFAMEFIGDTHDSVFAATSAANMTLVPVGVN